MSPTQPSLTVRFGDFRVGLQWPAAADMRFAAGWLDAPGQCADLVLRVAYDSAAGDCPPSYTRFDPEGFAFEGVRCAVRAEFASGGDMLLSLPAAPHRTGALFAGLLATAYAEVLRRGGVFLHAATLLHEGRAWVVAGHSGAGKTTLAARFADAQLHDEYAILVPTGGGAWSVWRYCESRGPRGDLPWCTPLAGIAVLGPDRSRTCVRPIAPPEAFAALFVHTYHAGGAAAPAAFEGVLALLRDFPLRQLSHCLAEPPAAVVAALEDARRAA